MTDFEGNFDLLAPLRDGQEQPELTGGEGARYWTADGCSVVDLNEMRVVLGQNNAAFQEAMEKAFSEFTAPKNGLSPTKTQLLGWLDRTTNGQFAAAHLTSSGSEAVEWAIRLAQKRTGRPEILAFWNSIHGRTYLSASLSGLPRRKVGYGPLAPGVVYLPYPKCADCPLQLEWETCGCACLELSRRIYRTASACQPAAVIIEPFQGADVTFPPKGYLRRLQDWAREEGMFVIVDEIQSGMGRTGRMYCYQEEGLEPDMLLLGKALGNGQHIAALLVRQRPDKEELYALSGGSGDDPVACVAACQVFEQLENGLLDHVAQVGERLVSGLKALESHPLVRECRGRGLAAAIEFVDEAASLSVYTKLKDAGFLLGHAGRSLYLKPPYVITAEQVEDFLAAMKKALQEERRG